LPYYVAVSLRGRISQRTLNFGVNYIHYIATG